MFSSLSDNAASVDSLGRLPQYPTIFLVVPESLKTVEGATGRSAKGSVVIDVLDHTGVSVFERRTCGLSALQLDVLKTAIEAGKVNGQRMAVHNGGLVTIK